MTAGPGLIADGRHASRDGRPPTRGRPVEPPAHEASGERWRLRAAAGAGRAGGGRYRNCGRTGRLSVFRL